MLELLENSLQMSDFSNINNCLLLGNCLPQQLKLFYARENIFRAFAVFRGHD